MHCLTILASLTFAQDFSNAMQPACEWFDKKEKERIVFSLRYHAEEPIILAKLSHREKIEPSSQRLYFVSERVFVYSDEEKTNKIFYIKTGSVKYEKQEPFDLNCDKSKIFCL